MQSKRVKFNLLSDQYLQDLEQLFCSSLSVMNSTLKGRVFDQEEFLEVVNNGFVSSPSDPVGFWCMTSKENDTFIGITGILKCNYLDQDGYEFGFILTEDNWGKGLATEIGQFWLSFAKNNLHFTEIFATASPKNEGSINVLKKLKMDVRGKVVSEERGERLVFGVEF